MAASKDWLPGTREGILSMARNWQNVCGGNLSEWGMPPGVLQTLGSLTQTSESVLVSAQNEAFRTPVITAQCKASFEAQEAHMRDMKRRYFLSPPLTDVDYAALGLKPHDDNPTPGSEPTAQVTIETYLIGRHELGFKIVYLTGSPNDPANKSYRLWYTLIEPGMLVPANPNELHRDFGTSRKKDVLRFEYGDSGKIAVIAVQVENGNKKGPWGPIVTALIP